jgi:hypothetical protein
MQCVTNRFGDTSSTLGYLGRLLPKTTLSVKSCGSFEGVASELQNLPVFPLALTVTTY